MPYKCAKIFKSGMAYFYEFDTDTCETSHTIYAVFTRFTRHQIERFPSIFVVWIKASERHDIGKRSPFRISVWIKISIWALPIYSVTTVFREKSPERLNVSSEQMVLPSIPTVLFKLLEQSYKKKQKKEKRCWKTMKLNEII